MSNALPVDVTMKCSKCKKAILERVQERFNEGANEAIEWEKSLAIVECWIDAKVSLDRIIKKMKVL